MRALLIMIVCIGCAERISPVGPTVSVVYPDAVARHEVATVRREVLVGRTFTVEGTFDATCARSMAPLFAKNDEKDYGTEYVACDEEKTVVTASCRGPCTAVGANVTATGPGAFEVLIDLKSRKRHYQETRKFMAMVPDAFSLVQCTEGRKEIKATPPWPRCHLDHGHFTVYLLANGHDLSAPVTVRSNGQQRDGNTFSLGSLVGTTPSGELVDGEYDVEVIYGSLVGRARFVVGYSAKAAN